ncbi:MAG: hypothetical protein QM756_36020 [Polyangiaceae bacterium]
MSNFGDVEGLRFNVPAGFELPALVTEFYEWVAGLRGVELGYFSLRGERLDDDYIEDGSRRASAFVGFLSTSDGSRIGFWRPNGEGLADAPVVMLGGEGDKKALGRSVEQFFARWATRRLVGVYDLVPDDEPESEEAASGRAELAVWLSARGVNVTSGESESDEAELERIGASIEAWFDAWSTQRQAVAESDVQRQALAAELKGLIGLPPEDKPWERTFADVIVTGTECRAYATMVGQRPLSVSPALEAAVRAFRDYDALELPEAGLWYRACFNLNAAGALYVQRRYVDEPNWDEISLDAAGLRQDVQRMPRSAYWTPSWLTELIQ